VGISYFSLGQRVLGLLPPVKYKHGQCLIYVETFLRLCISISCERYFSRVNQRAIMMRPRKYKHLNIFLTKYKFKRKKMITRPVFPENNLQCFKTIVEGTKN
jgi:hypothetical protein